MVITAAWGLGESVVGGAVTPDTYVVRKADLAVVATRIADKRRMTVALPGGAGGTAEREVPRFLRRRPCLGGADVERMARMAIALERSTGWPVDVECALAAGDLYLLQCRPVTALGARRNEQARRSRHPWARPTPHRHRTGAVDGAVGRRQRSQSQQHQYRGPGEHNVAMPPRPGRRPARVPQDAPAGLPPLWHRPTWRKSWPMVPFLGPRRNRRRHRRARRRR